MRLFFALWPSQSTAKLVTNNLLTLLPLSNSVPLAKLHVTLVFTGTAESPTAVLQAAEDIKVKRFRLVLDTLDYWPKQQLLCLQPTTPPTNLLTLVEKLQKQLQHHGIAFDERPYKPHMTLVKKVTKPINLLSFEPVVLAPQHFCLVASQNNTYTVLRHWSLE